MEPTALEPRPPTTLPAALLDEKIEPLYQAVAATERRSEVRSSRARSRVYSRVVDESSVLNRIEKLVAEEHTLWEAEAQGRLDGDGRERLTEVRRALDQAYKALRRRRAGQPGQGLRDRDVPDPPNDLDGPEPEPPHSEHGVHGADSSAEDPSPNVP
jgi:Protein of unknown function (DUF2630)